MWLAWRTKQPPFSLLPGDLLRAIAVELRPLYPPAGWIRRSATQAALAPPPPMLASLAVHGRRAADAREGGSADWTTIGLPVDEVTPAHEERGEQEDV